MPDLNVLLAKLKNATMISVNQSYARCLALDKYGYLVNVHDGGNTINRYWPLNLTLVDQIPLTQSNAISITFYGNAYYVGSGVNTIEVVDSSSRQMVNVITHSDMRDVHDIIFLGNGQTMVVSSTGNQTIVFFNRSSTSPVNYTYAYHIVTSFPALHGLRYVNDSFFYATSWNRNSVYSYATIDGLTWNETLFANVNNVVNGATAAHVTIDECGRRWISTFQNTMVIYDSDGAYIGNFTLALNTIFDALFMNNYVLYLSDYMGGKIVRLDRHITC